jgi:perosamine synthetase
MIPLFRPNYDEQEIDALRAVFDSHWLGLGPRTAEFEEKLAEYLGVKYVVALNSATAALHLALAALNIKKGDEVIVPSLTFISPAHAVMYCGATPVFVDVDPITLLADIDDVASKITDRTQAIIHVHYAGRVENIEPLRKLAGDIPIVEDAAHAMGAEYNHQKGGTFGTIGCFSFHAVKNLAAGDGGALVTESKEIYDKTVRMRWLGIDKSTWARASDGRKETSYSWQYHVKEIGFKYHMNDINAALGLSQLKKLDRNNKKRTILATRYHQLLSGITELQLPPADTDKIQSSWHLYAVQTAHRDKLIEHLKAAGIATGVHYYPIHLYDCYPDTPTLPITEKAGDQVMSLPMYPDMTPVEQDIVCNSIRSFFTT